MLMSALSVAGSAQAPVEIDGVYYRLMPSSDNVDNIAQIVARPDKQEYTGIVTLPAKVTYEGMDYSVDPGVSRMAFMNSTVTQINLGLGEGNEYHGIDLSLRNNTDLQKVTFQYMRNPKNEYPYVQNKYPLNQNINLGNGSGCVELFMREMEDHNEIVVNKFNVFGPDGKQLKPMLRIEGGSCGFIEPAHDNTFILDTDWKNNGQWMYVLKTGSNYYAVGLYGVDDEGNYQSVRCEPSAYGQTGIYAEINGLTYGIDKNATVIAPASGKDYTGDIVIPETIEYDGRIVPVAYIAPYSFKGTSVRSIKVESPDITIPWDAFSEARELTSLDLSALKLPDGASQLRLHYICESCPALAEVLLPACPADLNSAFLFSESLSNIKLFEGSRVSNTFSGTGVYKVEITEMPEEVVNPENKVAFRVRNNGLSDWDGMLLPLTLYLEQVVEQETITIQPEIYGDVMVFNRENFYTIRNGSSRYDGDIIIMCSNNYVIGDLGKVTFSEEQLAGVDTPQAEVSDAPARYYNLQGMEVDAEHLVPGIYIRRTADSASKVLVR